MPHRHRVEHRGAKPLGDRAHHEQVGGFHQRQHIFAKAGQQHALGQRQLLDLPLQLRPQLALAEDHQVRVRHFAEHQRHRVDQIPLSLVADQRADVDDHRHAVRQPVLRVQIERRPILNLLDVDPVVHDLNAPGGDAILHEDVLDRARRGDEAVDLAVFPLREGVRLEMKVDAPRGNDLRTRIRRTERQAQRRHRHGMRIVRVHDLRLPAADDLRELPRGGEIDFVDRRERKQVGALGGAPEELALGVRHEHGAVAAGPQAQHGQKDLLLSPAPGARGVDVEGEHARPQCRRLFYDRPQMIRDGVIESCSAAVPASTELPEFRKLQPDIARIHRRDDQPGHAVAKPAAEQVIAEERRRRMHHEVDPASPPALLEHLFRRQRRVAIHRLEMVGEVAIRVMLQLAVADLRPGPSTVTDSCT